MPTFCSKVFFFYSSNGKTFPRKVIYPYCKFMLTSRCVNTEDRAVSIAIPAEGPSFGVAPSVHEDEYPLVKNLSDQYLKDTVRFQIR